jgi:hypothetical protein
MTAQWHHMQAPKLSLYLFGLFGRNLFPAASVSPEPILLVATSKMNYKPLALAIA